MESAGCEHCLAEFHSVRRQLAKRPHAGYLSSMASGNPTLRSDTFQSLTIRDGSAAMTRAGTVGSTVILLGMLIVSGAISWNVGQTLAMPILLVGGIGGFIVAMITCFKKQWAPITAPIYALLEGAFLGVISGMYNAAFHGIVLQAILLTFGILAAMLFMYQTGMIKVTEQLRTVITAATIGVALLYLATFVLGFFGVNIPYIHGSGTVGIVFSVVVVGIASFNLLLDFDTIDKGVEYGVPKYMEWYCAFGLMVTLVWLYLEVLRLLSKLQRR